MLQFPDKERIVAGPNFNRRLERNGPRKAGVAAAFCWGGGFFIPEAGVYYHQIALLASNDSLRA